MTKKNISDIKKKYAISKHHAWAGSIFLAILLAIRVFLETSEINIDDGIILSIGLLILVYVLVSLILTYKYRSGLTIDENIIQPSYSSDNNKNEKIKAKIDKERLKKEKKKSKNELKKIKKSKN
jgi:hypothetical protein